MPVVAVYSDRFMYYVIVKNIWTILSTKFSKNRGEKKRKKREKKPSPSSVV